MRTSAALAAGATLASTAVAQSCISLSGSRTCPAFNSSSISTSSTVVGLYPFLQGVNSTEEFDNALSNYVSQGYVQSKYVNLFGCSNVDLGNTSEYYARYTTSFLCNGVIQNSRDACSLSEAQSRPLCADSCAEFARSEETIISSSEFCSSRSNNYADQLRADFTNCALPANSLTTTCIEGSTNEPNDCGFSNNLVGLCNFCRGSTENSTDSCCFTSNSENRCQDVSLPVFSSIADIFSSTRSGPTSSPTASTGTSRESSGGSGLSGGAIAGIVIGSIVGFLLLLALIIFACLALRKRRNSKTGNNILNQPSPQRRGMTGASYVPPPSSSGQGYEVLPGGRVARMAALSGDQDRTSRNFGNTVDPYGGSPESQEKVAGAIPIKSHRSPGSDTNNESSNEYSSPEGISSGQSEQLPFFKDYYSQDDIHPGDKVSILWAYQPRAGDEFELERGDMLKVIGIWDDGWATGVRLNERAEDYDGKNKAQRDSGVSNGTQTRDREEPSPPAGEIKAFPLVCVCLPEAWKKTVDGDTSTDGGSGGPPQF